MSRMESPYKDKPNLPLIRFKPDRDGRLTPYCEKHGAMLCYKYEIYRCPVCKSGIDMKDLRGSKDAVRV